MSWLDSPCQNWHFFGNGADLYKDIVLSLVNLGGGHLNILPCASKSSPQGPNSSRIFYPTGRQLHVLNLGHVLEGVYLLHKLIQ